MNNMAWVRVSTDRAETGLHGFAWNVFWLFVEDWLHLEVGEP